VTSPASVGSDERIRLFLGLRLREADLDTLVAWQHGRLERMRVLPRAHLHVTLAFLGHRPAEELPSIVEALREAAAAVAGEIRLTPLRYHETRSVAMLVLDDEDGRAGTFAVDLHAQLELLGVYRRERREWLPHLTVGRFRERPRLRLDPPRGTFVPSDAAAYLSRLRPGGAQYAVLESTAVGGS
jgi:RNA 2',3'-cyclic 3'-phosphodiesterase